MMHQALLHVSCCMIPATLPPHKYWHSDCMSTCAQEEAAAGMSDRAWLKSQRKACSRVRCEV